MHTLTLPYTYLTITSYISYIYPIHALDLPYLHIYKYTPDLYLIHISYLPYTYLTFSLYIPFTLSVFGYRGPFVQPVTRRAAVHRPLKKKKGGGWQSPRAYVKEEDEKAGDW